MNHRNAIVAFVMTGTLGITSLLPATAVYADTFIGSGSSGSGFASSGTQVQVTDKVSTSQTIPVKLTQDQAVAIVKAAIAVPTDAPSFASLENTFYKGLSENHHPLWNLSWRLGNPGDKDNGTINAVVDAVDGTLISFNTWKIFDQQSTFPPKVTQEQAASIAFDVIRKLQPDKAAMVKEIQNPVTINQGSLRGPFVYNLTFQRIVNNIPVPMDGFQIGVDGNGSIAAYHFQWSDVAPSAFPDPKQAIPVSKVAQEYDHDLNLQLAYQPFFSPLKQDGPEIHLIYRPNLSYNTTYNNGPYFIGSKSQLWFDATSGNLIDATGKSVSTDTYANTPNELDPNGQDTDPVALPEPLTVDQALEIAKKYVQADDSYTMNQSMNDNNGNKMYSFRWNKNFDPNSGPGIWMNVTIDAATGQLINLNTGKQMPSQQPPTSVISVDAAKQKAIEFVKKIMPNKTKALYLISSPQIQTAGSDKQNPVQYNFSFGELVNGIPSEMDHVNVMVNAITGDIGNYFQNVNSMQTGKAKYPNPQQVIPASKAKTEFEANNPLELAYVRPVKADSSGLADNYILVYTPNSDKPGEVLDATSGVWISPYGQVVNDQTTTATDIKGHWAEKQLQLMIERGILKVVNGKANPDAAITKGELIRMLILSIGAPLRMGSAHAATFSDVSQNNEYFPYVEAAVENHWIDKGTNFNPDDQVTREELAELLTRALGYKDLAKYTSIFNVPFADKEKIDDNYLGDVAIVNGLDIMRGSGQNFDPKQTVTIAQTSVALVKTIEIINSKTSSGPVYFIRQLQEKAAKMKQ